MPFTPFHVGPNLALSIPLRKKVDVFSFTLASVCIDLEPLIVMTRHLNYPVHGYAHTFLRATLVGTLWGLLVWIFRKQVQFIVGAVFQFPYQPTKWGTILSGILGSCFHVLLDAPLYTDIRPFYPLAQNPLYGLISSRALYGLCAWAFLPALAAYIYVVLREKMVGREGRSAP